MAFLSAHEVRRTPAYTFTEAAHYLRIPVTTLHAWCTGQYYRYQGRAKRYQKVIRLDGSGREGLSFLNLVEAHVLIGLRRCPSMKHVTTGRSSPSRLTMRVSRCGSASRQVKRHSDAVCECFLM